MECCVTAETVSKLLAFILVPITLTGTAGKKHNFLSHKVILRQMPHTHTHTYIYIYIMIINKYI